MTITQLLILVGISVLPLVAGFKLIQINWKRNNPDSALEVFGMFVIFSTLFSFFLMVSMAVALNQKPIPQSNYRIVTESDSLYKKIK